MQLLGPLAKLFSRAPTPPPPLHEGERQRLGHRRRAAERELRRLEKTLKRIGCSSCVQVAPSRGAIEMERAASSLRAEIAAIDRRLDPA